MYEHPRVQLCRWLWRLAAGDPLLCRWLSRFSVKATWCCRSVCVSGQRPYGGVWSDAPCSSFGLYNSLPPADPRLRRWVATSRFG